MKARMSLFGLFLFCLAGQCQIREIKAVVHCHTNRSVDSSATVEDIALQAKKFGVEAVVISDHNTDRDPKTEDEEIGKFIHECQTVSEKTGVLIVPGEEITCGEDWKNSQLHIVSPLRSVNSDEYHFISYPNCHGFGQVLQTLKETDRLIIMAHPFLDKEKNEFSDEELDALTNFGFFHPGNIKNFERILQTYLATVNRCLLNSRPLQGVTAENDYHQVKEPIPRNNLGCRLTMIPLYENRELNEENFLSALANNSAYATAGNLRLRDLNYPLGILNYFDGPKLELAIESPAPKIKSLALAYHLAVYINGEKVFGKEVNNSEQIKQNFCCRFSIPLPADLAKMAVIIYVSYPEALLNKATQAEFGQLITSPIIIVNPAAEKAEREIASRPVLEGNFIGSHVSFDWLLMAESGEIGDKEKTFFLDRGYNFSWTVLGPENQLLYTKAVKDPADEENLLGDLWQLNLASYQPINLTKRGDIESLVGYDSPRQLITLRLKNPTGKITRHSQFLRLVDKKNEACLEGLKELLRQAGGDETTIELPGSTEKTCQVVDYSLRDGTTSAVKIADSASLQKMTDNSLGERLIELFSGEFSVIFRHKLQLPEAVAEDFGEKTNHLAAFFLADSQSVKKEKFDDFDFGQTDFQWRGQGKLYFCLYVDNPRRDLWYKLVIYGQAYNLEHVFTWQNTGCEKNERTERIGAAINYNMRDFARGNYILSLMKKQNNEEIEVERKRFCLQ